MKTNRPPCQATIQDYLRRSTLPLVSPDEAGSLPIETLALAVLITANISEDFYNAWVEEYKNTSRDDPRCTTTAETLVLASLILAQKVLHDSPYTTTTWSEIGTPATCQADKSNAEHIVKE